MNTRYAERLKNVMGIFGVLLMFVAGIMLLPLLALPFYPEELNQALYFIIPGGAAMLIGWLLSRLRPKEEIPLSLRQDTVIVVGTWLAAAFFSALPFMMAGMLTFSQAYFETISGWTTTGLSMINVTTAPHIFLLFRSIMQFFGGVGLVLVAVSALSETFGMRLYCAEGHADKLLPNLAKSARMILLIYSGYFIAGTALYVVAGMPLFDAVNHCMAALSTGGFSIKVQSIGAYNSFPIELITVVLMLLGATNFFAHLLLVRGKFRTFFRLGEMRFAFLLIGIFVPLTATVSLWGLYGSLGQALRISLFNVVSAITTTGFQTVTYNDWPAFAWLILIIMMAVGGGAGSTAGGIKWGRVYLMLKVFVWDLRRKFMPEHSMNELAICAPEGKVYVGEEQFSNAASYTFIYVVALAAGTCVLAACGYSLQDSLFEFASALGTVGLSVGVTMPDMPLAGMWAMTAGMLLGRLEVYVVLIAFVKIGKDIGMLVRRR